MVDKICLENHAVIKQLLKKNSNCVLTQLEALKNILTFKHRKRDEC